MKIEKIRNREILDTSYFSERVESNGELLKKKIDLLLCSNESSRGHESKVAEIEEIIDCTANCMNHIFEIEEEYDLEYDETMCQKSNGEEMYDQ